MSPRDRAVAIVGGGTVGVGWTVVFARARFRVALFEPDSARRAAVEEEIVARLRRLEAAGLLGEPAKRVAAHVTCADALEAVVGDAGHVQECAPERLDVKRALFARLDELAPPDAVLATSSSALTATQIAVQLPGRARCLVAHPANPPYLLPVVELVPASFTDGAVLERARVLFAAAGMTPVVVRREIEGFVLNRLQGALLREAYCLVRDGVASVDDVDRVVRDGIGRRWAVIGPFETADLNARGGIAAHAETMGPAYERMGAERGQHDPWPSDLVNAVTAERRRRLPLEAWEQRVAWRDEALIVLERARRESAIFDDADGVWDPGVEEPAEGRA